jgi:hypothetical protein
MIGPLAGVLISGPIVHLVAPPAAGGRRGRRTAPPRPDSVRSVPGGAALLYVFLAPRLFAIAPQFAFMNG